MKPIYTVGSIAAIILLALAGWFILRPNIESTAVAPETVDPPAAALPTKSTGPTATAQPPTAVPAAVLDSAAATPLPRDDIPRISPEELKNLLDNGEDVLLIDTRGNSSFEYVHLPGAIMAPESFDNIPQDQVIVFYCDCVNESASAGAAVDLYKIDFTNVSALLGGIDAWEDANYPVEGTSAN